MDRPYLLYSAKELMRKIAPPRASRDLIAIKRVARYTINYPRMTCSYPWTELDSNIEVFDDAKFAGCNSTRKSTVEGVNTVEQSVCQSVVQNDGSSGPE